MNRQQQPPIWSNDAAGISSPTPTPGGHTIIMGAIGTGCTFILTPFAMQSGQQAEEERTAHLDHIRRQLTLLTDSTPSQEVQRDTEEPVC